jgi:hypothetical protein
MTITTTAQQANCLICHEVCQDPNQDIGYEGCECTVPYHTRCIEEWFTRQGQICPLCRKAVRVHTNGGPNEQFKNDCGICMILTVTVNFILNCIF